MVVYVSLIISIFAILVSGVTAWLTFFHRGNLLMTRPSVVYIGPEKEGGGNKFFFRSLMYSTSKRGMVIESLHVRIKCDDYKKDLKIWVYGNRDKLMRGSGLFIPQTGLTFDHHFLLSKNSEVFEISSGDYNITIFANLVGEDKAVELYEFNLTIESLEAGALMIDDDLGIYFDWDPDAQTYDAHLKQL